MISHSDIIRPNVILPFELPNNTTEDIPRVDTYPHIKPLYPSFMTNLPVMSGFDIFVVKHSGLHGSIFCRGGGGVVPTSWGGPPTSDAVIRFKNFVMSKPKESGPRIRHWIGKGMCCNFMMCFWYRNNCRGTVELALFVSHPLYLITLIMLSPMSTEFRACAEVGSGTPLTQ